MTVRSPLASFAFAAACLAAAPAAAKFTPIAGFDHQIFPSYIIASAQLRPSSESPDDHRLGDPRGVLGVEVVAPTDNAPITVTIQCDDCLEPSTFAGTLPKAGETYRVYPKIKYKYGFLARCVQSAPESMSFRVNVGHQSVDEEDTATCTVRTVNDCPFAISEGDNTRDVSYTFAAYVNEQHPFVDKLLREALDRGVVDSFTGYQASDPHEVMKQAYALWDLLVARDMRYSSITVSAVSSQTVASQHVRMIEDSVNNSQANCVDGSVLWASLMQRIGIDSFLVMESDHCYAGFFADPEHKSAYAIETTMLGADIDDEELEIPAIIEEAIPEDSRDARSFASFVGAINYSTARLSDSIEKKKEDAVECQIIDVAQAREQGVLPIAFQNGEEFVWYDYSGEGTDDETATDGNASPDPVNADEYFSEEADEDSTDDNADDADDESDEEAGEDDEAMEQSYDADEDEGDEDESAEEESDDEDEDEDWDESVAVACLRVTAPSTSLPWTARG